VIANKIDLDNERQVHREGQPFPFSSRATERVLISFTGAHRGPATRTIIWVDADGNVCQGKDQRG
jgi:hypothetical protein